MQSSCLQFLHRAHPARRMVTCHLCLTSMPATGHLTWVMARHIATEAGIFPAEIMRNRTAVGIVYKSSALCPYPEGPCKCTNVTANASVHICKPWAAQNFPFGSEFAFDTTGQEEVYVWARWDCLCASAHTIHATAKSHHTWHCNVIPGNSDLTIVGHSCQAILIRYGSCSAAGPLACFWPGR